MQTITEIQSLLNARGLAPRRRLGQNFLHDHNQLRRLVAAAEIQPHELILEVGPGTGTLTEALLEADAHVIACELDPGLGDLIAERFEDRITLVRGDCLERGRRLAAELTSHLGERPFKLVANLPYQVASALMIELLIHHPNCCGQYITIQREVGDRLVAHPGTKERGPLGIIASSFADVDRIGVVPASCFWPQPKVVSAMVSLIPKDTPQLHDRTRYARFITELFAARRKQLGRILGRDRQMPAGIDPSWRPEVLTNEQLLQLYAWTDVDDA
ncbi:MAG: 16S rRNA (adenine(1518)-N(6)/adenine(1519)-N(6))-dimethyltransferase RsmA [Phycisphaerales bacterium]|nr:16S rRNA (adenine(1518)-N(6)/adenine(1519)-N(6))-dimethyltransferase RsmA [Phycisphaerales bacterium]